MGYLRTEHASVEEGPSEDPGKDPSDSLTPPECEHREESAGAREPDSNSERRSGLFKTNLERSGSVCLAGVGALLKT